MKRQDRLRRDAKKQSLQDASVIEHLARSLAAGRTNCMGREQDAGRGRLLQDSLRRRWTGGLPEF
jgi:hypothetical protein